jgi:ATP-binding cassette subfamily B protein/subfamily B ATP-binding cassette protein MsbA
VSRWWLRLGRYARPEAPALAGLLSLVLVGVVLEALTPWPLKLVVDNVLTGDPLPSAVAWIGRLPGADTPAGLLGWLAGAVLGLFAAFHAVQMLAAYLKAGLGGRIQYALAGEVFERLQALSLRYHARARRGDLVRRVTTDTGCVPALVTGALLPLVTSLASLAVLFAIMWHLDPVLSVVALSVAVPMGVLIRLLGPRMTERAYAQQQIEGEVWALTEQTLTALPVVQAFAREEIEGTRFRGVATRTIRAYLRTITAQLQFKVGIDGAVALGTAVIMVIGGLKVATGSLSLGSLVVFLGYLVILYDPLSTLAYLSSGLAESAASARRVIEVLDAHDVLGDAPGAVPLAPGPDGSRGHVRIEGVTVGYEPGRPVLRDVSLEGRPGEAIAIVGATGAGKSTLVSLIPRLFDPWEGRVLIDGKDLRQVTLASVRAQVAMVLQDPFLLPVSIAENIGYGRPGATREDVLAAAVAAQADEFIRHLPQGYDTVLAERGASLSGGQRQRLAIARALLKDAPILILDEPTAALDAETEALAMAAIERVRKGRTTFVIAHRLSTVRGADRVVTMCGGQVSDAGPTQDLPGGGLSDLSEPAGEPLRVGP